LIKLKKSTLLIIGIVCFNFIIFPDKSNRSYEIQFQSASFLNKLEYNVLSDMRIDKIIIRVFHTHKQFGGLLFKNSEFKYNNTTLDHLMGEINHSNCRLWAWMITRKYAWLKNGDLFDYSRTENKKKRINKLDIFNPHALDKLTGVFKELAKNKISGILIQDDLFLRYNEGFSSWGKAQFKLATGQVADEKKMMERGSLFNRLWIEVKVRQVTNVLKRLIKVCKSVNPEIKMGMNVFYETPVFKNNAAAWYAHSLQEITASDLDWIYLMSYHRQIKREMKLSEKANKVFFKNLIKRAYDICGEKLVVKIQIRDWRTGKRIALTEIQAYLNLVDKRVKRICFTPVSSRDQEYLQRILKNRGSGTGELSQ